MTGRRAHLRWPWLPEEANKTREVEVEHRNLFIQVYENEGKEVYPGTLQKWRRWWKKYLKKYRPDLKYYNRYD